MTLADELASDCTTVLLSTDDFARSVTYHPDGGSDKAINAIVQWLNADVVNGERTRSDTQDGLMWIAQDATNGIAAPTSADEVTVEGKKYAIVGEAIDQDGMWRLTVHWSDPLERGATPFRMARI